MNKIRSKIHVDFHNKSVDINNFIDFPISLFMLKHILSALNKSEMMLTQKGEDFIAK